MDKTVTLAYDASTKEFFTNLYHTRADYNLQIGSKWYKGVVTAVHPDTKLHQIKVTFRYRTESEFNP